MTAQEVYVVIIEDRHADTEVFIFSNQDKAIKWAKIRVRKFNRYGYLNEELTQNMKDVNWLYYGCYSCNGDHIRVIKCLIDSEI